MKNHFHKKISISLAAILCVVSFTAFTQQKLTPKVKPSERPNILVVLVDDMGNAHINSDYEKYTEENVNQDILQRSSSRNDPYSLKMAIEATKNSMPTIQKLMSEGVRFTDSHVANSLCAPSRAGILTGNSSQRYGIYNNMDMNNFGVPENELMLPELFQQNGYATASIGKWHVGRYNEAKDGYAYDGQHPNDRGFDYYFGFNRSGTEYYNSTKLYENKTKAVAKGYLTDQFTDHAIDFIKTTDKEPFFMYLAYNCPHGPLNKLAPAEYDDKFKHLPRVLRIWNSYMYAVDEGVRKITKALEEAGKLDNTLIIFLSDNGASGGTPLPANGYYRGHKGSLYMGGTRTGMMAWWPGKIPAESKCDQLISSLDVLPTCLEAASIATPKNLDGKSMLDLITGKNNKPIHKNLAWANRNALSWSYPRDKNRDVPAAWTVKTNKWVLHYWADDDQFTLYDAKTDLAEKNDVAMKNTGVVKELEKQYAEWFKKVKEPLDWDKERWIGLKPKSLRTKSEELILKNASEKAD